MKKIELKPHNIPKSLKDHGQWVCWRIIERDGKETKVPFQFTGIEAKSNDPATWCSFERLMRNYRSDLFMGIGFVFSADDDFVGVDLDGCRNSETGWVAEWAKEIILKFSSYAEVSPSLTGVKIFCRGKSPFSTGKKIILKKEKMDPEKEPAIEVYEQGRYFAVTGWVLAGQREVRECQDALDWIKETYWKDEPKIPLSDFRSNDAVVERARKYIAKLDPAISGQGGQGKTFHAACVLALDFELSEADAMGLMREYNARCVPEWTEKELARKVRDALKQPGQRGRLRNASPQNWDKIRVETYRPPNVAPAVRVSTLGDAALRYLESLGRGEQDLYGTSIADLDYALGGGVGIGEMVIFGARPSHGKSAVALQCLHYWTELDIPCAMVSEEMGTLMLGKRTIQHLSPLPQEHWFDRIDALTGEVKRYQGVRKNCFVIEQCGQADRAAEQIEKLSEDEGIKCAVIDYAQLLKSPGVGRYEQITNTSIVLRQLANRTKVTLLVLCQFNREIENRAKFTARASDLKDSGQLEQDADVICSLCWPFKVDASEDRKKYIINVLKNRNREIREFEVECDFNADRQMFLDKTLSEIPA